MIESDLLTKFKKVHTDYCDVYYQLTLKIGPFAASEIHNRYNEEWGNELKLKMENENE